MIEKQIDNSLPYNEYGQMAQAIKYACAVYNNIQGTKISNTLISYKPLSENYLILCFKQDVEQIKKKEQYLLTKQDESDIMIVDVGENEEIRAFLHFAKQFLQQPYVVVHKDFRKITLPEWILVFEKNIIRKYEKGEFFNKFLTI